VRVCVHAYTCPSIALAHGRKTRREELTHATCVSTHADARLRTRTRLPVATSVQRFVYTRARARACIRTIPRAHAHTGALHLAGAHIIAGIHNADVFMALTRLFLVRCRPQPTPPRPCP